MSEVVGCLDLALSIQERNDFSPQRVILTRKVWSIISPKGYFEFNSRVATRTPESKGTNGEIVSIRVPTLVTDPLEGQDANYDPLPAIHGFQIFGDAFPGGKLLATGYCINGTVCSLFQWVRYLSDGTIRYLEGATNPSYTVSLGDIGTYLCVQALPMDENGRMGNLFTCFANKGLLITQCSK